MDKLQRYSMDEQFNLVATEQGAMVKAEEAEAKIADLERQLEKTEQVVRIYDEIIMNTKQKLAEATSVLEDIVTLPPRTGTWTIADIQELAQDFLKGE